MDRRPHMKNTRWSILVVAILLALPIGANALNLGGVIRGMAAVNQGYQQGYDRAMQSRLLELQVEEANRMAVIQQLEYQRRIKELDEVRQRELQRQQQLNVEALRREQARIAEIHFAEQARVAQVRAAEQASLAQTGAGGQKLIANAQAENTLLANQKSVSFLLARIAGHLRESSPRELNKGVSLIGASSKENKLYLLVKLDTVDTKVDPYKKVNNELQNQISGAIVTTCLDQTLEPLTRQGAIIRYSFFDAKQSLIEAIDTDKADCVELYGSK